MSFASAPDPAAAPGGAGSVVHISPMRQRHLRSVLRIEAAVYPRPWSRALFMSELSMRSARSYLVARVLGEVVGYAGLMFAPTEAHVTTLAVDPAAQRRHVATRLMLAQVRVAMRHGFDAMTLEVRESNLGAQSLYEGFGFEAVGIRRGYYVERAPDGSTLREDAVVMWLRDLLAPERIAAYTVRERSLPGRTDYDAPLRASGIEPGRWTTMDADGNVVDHTPREIDL